MPTISTLSVDIETHTSKFSRGMRIATAGLGALAAGAAFAFKQFEASEKVINQTGAVIKSTGSAANVTTQQVTDLAGALSKKAGIDDELIQSGENVLLTFKNIANEAGRGNDIFNQATKAALDLSVAMGQDMKSSAIQVGKALNDPIAGLTALTRVGVSFTEQQKQQIEKLVESGNQLQAQRIILQELTTEFGGSAEAQATASGKMQVALGNLAESIGALLAPAIEKLVGWITRLAEWFNNLDPGMQSTITTAAAVTAGIIVLGKAFGGLTGAIHLTSAALALFEAHPVIAFLTAMGAIIAVVATKWDDLSGGVKIALGLFASGATAIGLLINRFDDIKDSVVSLAEFLGRGLVTAWHAVQGAAIAALNGIITGLNAVIRAANTAAEAIANISAGPLAPFVNVPDIPTIPHAAKGGFVARSGLAVIHQGENIIPAVGGAAVNITINGWVGNDQQIARRVRDEFNKLGARNANTGLLRP